MKQTAPDAFGGEFDPVQVARSGSLDLDVPSDGR